MAEIDGGALSFKSVMDNDQINTAIEETLRRVQGLSDGTVAGGKKMDAAFDATADNIRNALGQIGTACEMHEKELQNLESEYQRLGQKASAAFMAGRDEEYSAITNQQNAIKGEITVRERLLQELRDQSNELEKVAQKQDENRQKTEENANTQTSMRSRIKALREEMMLLVDQGINEQSEAYQRLKNELGRLVDIQSDVAQQGRTLANDEQKFQGIITGLSGLAGGFSAVTGAVGLFAGENEDLNKVMTKVQSVMAITIGLQQVAQTLNKDSAFQLVTLNSLKEWWRNVVAQAAVAETAETVATTANTAAQEANAAATAANTASEVTNTVATGAQATAATAGTVANIGLAGAFRLVGVAIKSIPVFGWIIAGISALIGLYAYFSNKASEAKKAQEEFSKAMIDGCYKPIGTVESLSEKYKELGDNLEAKKTFIEQNKKAFDELGVSVNDVTDAENLLIRNKDAFIEAQIAKAKATVYMQQSMEKIKKQMELEQEISQMPDKVQTYIPTSSGMYGGTGYYVTGENSSKAKKKKELEDLKGEIKTGYQNAASEEQKGFNILKKAGINGANTYKAGTIGAIEQAISSKQDALKRLSDPSQIKANIKETEKLQKQLDSLTGKKEKAPKKEKDPFLELLEKQKKEYDRFMKWINSGDQILAKAANKEFAGLLKQGASYIEYLKNQREQILAVDVSNRSKAQNKQLRMLNDQIAEETKKTVLEAFNTELSDQLSNAKTVMEMLNIIAQKRKALANDNTEVDNGKKDTLDEAEKTALQKQKEETDSLLEEYASYLDKRIKLEMDYNNDITLLEKRLSQATTDADKEKIKRAITNRTKQYQKDTKGAGDADYDQMIENFRTFEQKKQGIIDEYTLKRAKAQEHGDTKLDAQLLREQSKALLQNSLDELKSSPDYIRAFEDLKDTSTSTLETLLAEFEKVKFAAVESMDAESLRTYAEAMSNISNELNNRDPFTAIKKGYRELKIATNELAVAKNNLKKIQANGGSGTDEEAQAINKVNKAKDNYIKKSNNVKAAEKAATAVVKDLCDELSNVGSVIGGQAGLIISMIGDIGSFTMSAIQGFETASKASSEAISTIEKASVILMIISAAFQIANKISAMFGANYDDYNKAKGAYEDYIKVLDEVIEKQKELVESMSGENAQNSYNYAAKMIEEEVEAARTLGKERLNSGASAGSHSIGIRIKKGMSNEGWQQALDSLGVDAYNAMKAGRMEGLFDLSIEQLEKLKTEAPIFWAKLDGDVKDYLGSVISAGDSLEELKDSLNESLTGVSFDSLSDDFLSILQDMDADAAQFSDNFSEYMRKAIIQNLYKEEYKDKLEKWYQMWSNAMNVDSDGGLNITDMEQAALDTLKNSIVTGALNAADAINAQFGTSEDADTSLTGAVKGVSEETASLIGGQMNAMRINQLEATAIMRQQLIHLATIALNTSYNVHLLDIRNDIREIKNSSGSSLRSQGLS